MSVVRGNARQFSPGGGAGVNAESTPTLSSFARAAAALPIHGHQRTLPGLAALQTKMSFSCIRQFC
jgi:hypothetical protein